MITIKKITQNKNVFLICIGSFISSIGDNLYNIALTLSMYSLSHSVSAVAWMWLVRAVIRVPGQFFSGIIADYFNRRNIIVFINIVSGVICSLFLFIDKNSILVFLIILLLQATSDVDNTASMAMIPELVEKEELAGINSLFSIISTITLMISPALAGILYLKYGVLTLYMINAISFIVGGVIFSRICYTPAIKSKANKHEFTLLKFSKEGLAVVLKSKLICTVIVTMLIFAVLGRFYEIYKIYIADKILDIGDTGIIYFSYAMGVGSLLAPLLIKYFKLRNIKNSVAFLIVSVISSISFFIFGNSSHFVIVWLSILMIGLFQTIMSVYTNSIIQGEVESQFLGRVFSFYKLSIIISAIVGILISPILLSVLGTAWTFSIFSCISLFLIVLIIFYSYKKNQCNIYSSDTE